MTNDCSPDFASFGSRPIEMPLSQLDKQGELPDDSCSGALKKPMKPLILDQPFEAVARSQRTRKAAGNVADESGEDDQRCGNDAGKLQIVQELAFADSARSDCIGVNERNPSVSPAERQKTGLETGTSISSDAQHHLHRW